MVKSTTFHWNQNCHDKLFGAWPLTQQVIWATLPFTGLPKPNDIWHQRLHLLSGWWNPCISHKSSWENTSPQNPKPALSLQAFPIKTIPHTCRESGHVYFLMSNTYPTPKVSVQSLHTRWRWLHYQAEAHGGFLLHHLTGQEGWMSFPHLKCFEAVPDGTFQHRNTS